MQSLSDLPHRRASRERGMRPLLPSEYPLGNLPTSGAFRMPISAGQTRSTYGLCCLPLAHGRALIRYARDYPIQLQRLHSRS